MPLAMDSGACADVLAQERRWLTAITDGDRAGVESILGHGFKHINSDGKLLDRAAEVASIEKMPFTMNPSGQLVDVMGDTAVIHGVNTSPRAERCCRQSASPTCSRCRTAPGWRSRRRRPPSVD
jgi:hypothetical protein